MVAAGLPRFGASDAPTGLLPVHDKALMDYALEALLAAGIRRILIVAAPADAPSYQAHLGGGEKWGGWFSYLIAPAPAPAPSCALAMAIALGGEFVGRRTVALAAADRVITGRGLDAQLKRAAQLKKGARVFVCDGADADSDSVADVAAVDVAADAGAAADAATEPSPGLAPGQTHAGLFFYDSSAAARMLEIARQSPSPASPPRLSDLHRAYQTAGRLRVETLDRAVKSLRVTGPDSLRAAARAVAAARRENSP